jgi:branched-chain amino acid transport system substrate-binding protein
MKLRHFVLLITCLALVSCDQSTKQSSTVKIGFCAVLTGPDGPSGSKMLEGVRVAVDEWNARGGLLGKPIELIVRDDEGKPDHAVAAAHELVSQNAIAVIGHYNSGCTIPASNIYADAGVLEITPASTNPKVTEQGIQTVFRDCGRDDQQGSVGAEFAYNKLGIKKIAIIHNKTPYGEGLATEFRKKFEELGGQVTSFSGVPQEELDFRANIENIKNEKAEGLFWGGMYAQGGPLYNQLRQAGLTIPMLSGEGCCEPPFIQIAGPQAKNVYFSYGQDYHNNPLAKAFLEIYHKRFGQEGPYSVYGYEAANMLFESIQQTKSTDAKKLATYLRSKPFNTALGTLEFDDKGDLKKAQFVEWTIQDGKFVVDPRN